MNSCPFLSRISFTTIRSNATKILQRAGECPVMRNVTRSCTTDTQQAVPVKDDVRACPYLSKKLDTKIGVIDLKSDDVNSLARAGEKAAVKAKPFHPLLERMMKGNADMKGSEDCLFNECDNSGEDIQYCGLCGTSADQIDAKTNETQENAQPYKDSSGDFDYEGVFSSLLKKKKDDRSYRVFKRIERKGKFFPKAREHTGGEKEVTVWCSNDYMGMSWHPYVIKAAKSTIDTQGTGSGGTRNISGNLILHETLEKTMADIHDKEGALVFTSCYVANQWALDSLGRYLPGCVFVSDENNHASMIEGIKSSRAQKLIYKHNSVADLEAKLKTIPKGTPTIVVFESVHSMTGTISPIEEICDLARSYGALTFLDEVHAVGLYGQRGAGVAEEIGCVGKVDIITGTFGKAYGNIGGYIAGSNNLIDFLRSYSSGFIFTTSLPPPVMAGALTAVNVLASAEGQRLRATQREIVRSVRSRLQRNGLPASEVPSHIIPVHVGDAELCLRISNEMLQNHGIYIQSINYPTVPRGEELLRIAPTPHHSQEDIDTLIEVLTQMWAKFGGPYLPNGKANVAL